MWLLVSAGGVLCVLIVLLQLLARPDPARIEQEQRAVFSSYLFEYPLEARPLPTLCADLQGRNESGMATKLLIANQTISRLPVPFGHHRLTEGETACPWGPFRYLQQFLRPESGI